MANRPRSQAIQRRLSFSATAAVVPLPHETVEHKIAFVRRGFDDALQQGFGLLRGVTCSFHSLVMDFVYICPDILNDHSLILIFKSFKTRHALFRPVDATFTVKSFKFRVDFAQ